ncbi:hypothetical protein OAG10_00715 [Verrucomicrobia bacterium]|nr:hypothetical protein [Verrucomicrobiota bacterium]
MGFSIVIESPASNGESLVYHAVIHLRLDALNNRNLSHFDQVAQQFQCRSLRSTL